jgi:hypothetical protein
MDYVSCQMRMERLSQGNPVKTYIIEIFSWRLWETGISIRYTPLKCLRWGENATECYSDRKGFDDFDYDEDATIRTSMFNQASFDLKGFCYGSILC